MIKNRKERDGQIHDAILGFGHYLKKKRYPIDIERVFVNKPRDVFNNVIQVKGYYP